MNDEKFLDTNIIYYAYDLSEPSKRAACKKLVEQALQGKIKGVISNQILVELFNTLSRKLGVPAEKARIIVKTFIASEYLKKIDYTHNTVDRALNSSEMHRVPFLDALISETMKENGVTQIITENEKDFSKISDIKVINPFKS